MNRPKHIHIERHEGAFVVHFIDRKIAGEPLIDDVSEELCAVADRPDCLKLVLNFSAVEFLSSVLLGTLTGVRKRMAAKGGTLRLCELCENIRLIFRMTTLDSVLDIRDTEADAVADAQKDRP